jgi:zinc protease
MRGPDDTTAAMAKTLNEYRCDLFITSGHASERDWQLGYSYRNGQFRCAKGQLFGLDTSGKRHPIDSPNPKVYMPVGNCLMGNIDRPDCMALAWMNSAGVMQMIGYTVSTWFGYAGWGCLNYFVEQPGRYTFTEAFFANQQALIHALELSAGDAQTQKGLKFDSTVVAFYGDPAWQARMAAGKLAFEQLLIAADGRWTFEVKPKDANSFGPIDTNGSQRQPRPFVAFFDRRLKDVEVVEGAELKPVITDDFILVERPAACDPSKTYRVVFRARPIQ